MPHHSHFPPFSFPDFAVHPFAGYFKRSVEIVSQLLDANNLTANDVETFEVRSEFFTIYSNDRGFSSSIQMIGVFRHLFK